MSCEIAKTYHVEEVTARKTHQCCECSAPINKGELHLKVFGIWSWGKQTYRQHLKCMEACMLIRDELNGGDCIGFGELFEYYNQDHNMHQLDRDKEPVKRFRNLLAEIIKRERSKRKKTNMTILADSPTPDKCSRFITIYEPMGGWNAVEYWWNPEGFWEPWETGFGPYYGFDAKQQAIANAESWAENDGIPLYKTW